MESTDSGVNGGIHLGASTPGSADDTHEVDKTAHRLFANAAEAAGEPVLVSPPGNSVHHRFAAQEGIDE